MNPAKYIIGAMRLEAAIKHHQAADRFKEDHDDALYAARDRVTRGLSLPTRDGDLETLERFATVNRSMLSYTDVTAARVALRRLLDLDDA